MFTAVMVVVFHYNRENLMQLYDIWFDPDDDWFYSWSDDPPNRNHYPMRYPTNLTFEEAQEYVKINSSSNDKTRKQYTIVPAGQPYTRERV